ncbi:MAG: FAD-binding protein [Calditrichaeota bacterium]|nr:MAG: FAD-binding protein [Calditrichota bacterium]
MKNLSQILNELTGTLGKENVIFSPEELIVYEADGFTMNKALPEAVVFPRDTNEVQKIVKILAENEIPFVPRGAGTGLSGGCLTPEGGIIIALAKLNKILKVEPKNRIAVVQCGVVNAHLSREVEEFSLCFAPDPSSQFVCTIGGNVAENAGGPHTLKYGVTTNHILGLKVILPNGELVELGSEFEEDEGLDLVGTFVGSEGTFGIVTEITCKLTPLPSYYKTFLTFFKTVEDGTNTVAEIIASGVIPAALEMLDSHVLSALESAFNLNIPKSAKSILIIELDGFEEGVEAEAKIVKQCCEKNNAESYRFAETPQERLKLWTARKKAFGALGRATPNYYTQDGVVPRSKLPEMLNKIYAIGEKFDLKIANIFHAGDGNLHPAILFDARNSEQTRRAEKASEEILKACINFGGSISGEHGIGLEKQNLMGLLYTQNDLEVMKNLKEVFNPKNLCNPSKIFPTNKGCIELSVKQRSGYV